MSNMYLIVLVLVASIATYTIWYVSSKNAEMLTQYERRHTNWIK
jgi:hypothetical protein